ncbi:MAG: YfjI family protein [Pseudomonadota bacterium]|nr:YfjI family protein [Pseudomonadota bacterium]
MSTDDNDLLGRGELPKDPAVGGKAVTPRAERDWDAPIPLETPVTLPRFPLGVLPSYASSFVAAVATETQSPQDLAGMFALSVLSTIVAKTAEVAGTGTHVEPLVLWTCTALASGERKTAVFQHITHPLTAWELSENKKREVERPRREAERRVTREALKKLEERAASVKQDVERESLIEEMAELTRKEERLGSKPPRLICGDATPESVVSLMSENDGRIAILSAEGEIFEVMKGRYSRAPNLAVFLAGHAGENIPVDRIGRDALTVSKGALTTGISPQPYVLRWATSFEPFAGSGILGRFLYALPVPMAGRRSVRNIVPIDPGVRSAYDGAIRSLLSTRRPGLEPVRIRATAAALERLLDFSEDAERRLGRTEAESPMRSWLSKLPGAVLRVAGITHACAEPDRPLAEVGPIGEAAMSRAIEFGQYLVPHAEAVFGLAGPEMRHATVILRWLIKDGVQEFQARTALAARQSVLKDMAAVRAALRVLLDHDFIREKANFGARSAGRPSSPWFEVNPAAASVLAPR